MTIRNLDALLAPKSVALVGASERQGSVGGTIARNLLRAGFEGRIDFVNPGRDEVAGHRCHRSIDALAAAPDLAIIAIAPEAIAPVVEKLAARGTRAAVVISAGMDQAQTTAMLEAGRDRLFRVLGPNCIGLMVPRIGLDASFCHRMPNVGDLAFVSQSGALVTSIVDWSAEQDIGFSHVISLGNMADVDFGDLLDYLAGDPRCRAILLYIEAITEPAKFMSAARRAARAKPVVVIKSGRHASAAKAAATHTGRLAGSDAAYDAALRRAGILRVYDLPELFEAASILARNTRLDTERLTIVTNGGGAGVLAADRLADFDGRLADLSDTTRAALDRVLPATWSGGNPIDIIGDAGAPRLAAALDIVLADPEPSVVLVINCPTALVEPIDMARATVASVERHRAASIRGKTVITNWLGEPGAVEARKLFAAKGIATFDTPGAAVRGLMQVVRYSRAQEALMRTPSPMSDVRIHRDEAARLLAVAASDGRTTLTEPEAKAVVAAYGIAVVESRIAATPADVAEVATSILASHPAVALKILSRDISHKSDVGGVRLDIASAASAREQATAMLERVTARIPNARIDGFTLAPMIRRSRAHELIIGMSVDATFGPLIMFGAGGTAVEVMRDTALALPPLDMELAHDLIRQTRISRLLAGYRDRPPADLDAIADALVRIGQLVSDHAVITEIDINPLLADDKGVLALDARICVSAPGAPERTAMSIRPYPAHWEKSITIDDFGDVLLRPIRPEDERLYGDFLGNVTAADHRLRFFTSRQGLTHRDLARFTQIDYARDMAFVAIEPKNGRLLGVSRYSADPDRLAAEYAVLVRSDLKGRGIGWALMRHLIDHARTTGIGRLFGSVLAENSTMLAMCRSLGFAVRSDPADPSLYEVHLPLNGA